MHGWWLLIGCAVRAGDRAEPDRLCTGASAATFSAVGLYAQVIAAAGYAWLILDEHLAPIQLWAVSWCCSPLPLPVAPTRSRRGP
jgi:hypothetical protein